MRTMNWYIEGFEGRGSGAAARDAEALIERLLSETVVADGVVRWRINGAVVPGDIAEFAAHVGEARLGFAVDVAACSAARNGDFERFFEQYRVAMRQRTAGEIAQQRAEARAAMGPGVDMVNIVTGERYTT